MKIIELHEVPVGARFLWNGDMYVRIPGEAFDGLGVLGQHIGSDGTLTTWDDDGTPVCGAFFRRDLVSLVDEVPVRIETADDERAA